MLGKIFMWLLVGLAIAMAVPQSRARLVDEMTPVLDEFRARLVPRRLDTMADQLEVRVGRGEGFPSNFEGWLGRSFSGPELDPWGHHYYLQVRRRSFTVGSLGPDGEPATEDDIELERDVPGRR
jgi:hypothetical protein